MNLESLRRELDEVEAINAAIADGLTRDVCKAEFDRGIGDMIAAKEHAWSSGKFPAIVPAVGTAVGDDGELYTEVPAP